MTTATDNATAYSRPSLHATGHWSQIIGYALTTDGKRTRKFWSFGRDENAAIAAAVARQKEWADLKSRWRFERRGLEENFKGMDWSKPVWLDSPWFIARQDAFRRDEEIRQRLKDEKDRGEAGRLNDERPDLIDKLRPSAERPEGLTLAQVKERFLQARKSEVGLAAGLGIKATSYNGIVTMMNAALGISLSTKNQPKVTGRKPIDVDRPMSGLTYADIEAFRNYWLALPDGISVRTAINYCNHFKMLLNWADLQDDIDFTLPRKAAGLFKFKGMKGKADIADFDPELFKRISKGGTTKERTRLYFLLALNCGFYQQDLSDLRADELVKHKGRLCIWRGRSRTSHQNEFETLHTLWAETATLLEQHRAPEANEHGRLILNKDGLPLVREEVGGRKTDAITAAWEKCREQVGFDLPFKQLRKIGFNAVKRISNGREDVARMYAGHATPGVAAHSGKDDFGLLTEALDKWHEELTASGIL